MLRLHNVARLLIWLFMASVLAALAIASTPVAHGAEVLLQFYSDHCPPCHEMEPVVRELETSGYAVQRVNVDVDHSTADQYQVTGVPCFVLLADGREQQRITGKTDRDRLEKMFQQKKKERQPVPHHKENRRSPAPTPAWRFENPDQHRGAVVRICCDEQPRGQSYGSGVYVAYDGLKLVVTASHVTQNAKAIQVRFYTGHQSRAKVLSVDATWDVCVLALDSEPDGITPVALEYGDAAMQQPGNPLESCGYGPDGKLACNHGQFLQYVHPAGEKTGDWMEFFGHARQGDSGGPVFNANGKVVGILWGTDGTKVVGVQAGRLHLALQTAAGTQNHKAPPLVMIPEATACPCESGLACATTIQVEAQSDSAKKRLLPYRAEEDKHNQATDERLDKISNQLTDLQRDKNTANAPSPAATVEAEAVPEKPEASPLIAGLYVLGAVIAGTVIYFAAAAKA